MAISGSPNVYVQYYQDGVDHKSGSTPKLNGASFPCNVSISAAAGASNVCNITITVKDNQVTPVAMTVPSNIDIWLSDASTGLGLTATNPSAASFTTGNLFVGNSALSYFRAQTNASGVAVLSITNASKTTYYVSVKVPGYPGTFILHLTTGNYG